MKKRMKKGKYSKPRNLVTKLSELASEKTLHRHFLPGKLHCVILRLSEPRCRPRVEDDRRRRRKAGGKHERGGSMGRGGAAPC